MIADIIILIINLVLTLAVGIFSFIIKILPDDPFKNLNLSYPTQLVSYFNWLFPFGQFIAILSLWATAMGVYMFVHWIMKRLKVA